MKNIPEKIYLQIGDDGDEFDFNELGDVSWCSDKVFENDTEYLSKDYVLGLIEDLANKIYASDNIDKNSKVIALGTYGLLKELL